MGKSMENKIEIYFSPTGGTKKVTDELSQALSDDIERVT